MEIFVIVGLLVVVLVLWYFLRTGKNIDEIPLEIADAVNSNPGRLCPLCSHRLQKGQTVKSRLTTIIDKSRFQSGVQESVSHVLGCPFCYPANSENPRLCPVCREQLKTSDYVIGRYFERTARPGEEKRKDHLHVLGCTICYSRK